MRLHRLRHTLRHWMGKMRLAVWYSPDYRLPVTSLESITGIDLRRADYAMWFLAASRVVRADDVHRPMRVGYPDLARVHHEDLLASLSDPEFVARAFGVEAWDIPCEEVVHTVRLACGATLEAAHFSLETQRPTLNLLGGFHHAYPGKSGGLSLLNDIAVAVKSVRHQGFRGPISVIDLDAHPPDGTAACLHDDDSTWIGSLSASDWGRIEGVDEIIVAQGCSDEVYLDRLRELIKRMPPTELAFVLAGGDVLAGDHMGMVGLSLNGARKRDLMVARVLDGIPSVWLPGGGYHRDSWKVLGGTALAVGAASMRPIPEDYRPLRVHFTQVFEALQPEDLGGDEEPFMTDAELAEMLGMAPAGRVRLLDYYTADGFEYGLYRYGILETVRRLGYRQLKIEIDRTHTGDRVRLVETSLGDVLIECVLSREHLEDFDETYLFVNWLTLRHPKGKFTAARPQLPGQEVPGLGLVPEMAELLRFIAKRLELKGIMYRPSWFHIAYVARVEYRYRDPARQGRFEAMLRDLSHLPLLEVTRAAAQGRVRLNGEPYTWEAANMVDAEDLDDYDEDLLTQARETSHFTLEPGSPGGSVAVE